MAPSSGSVNLLRQLTKLGETFTPALDILPLDIFLGEGETYFKSKRVEHYQNFSLYIHIVWLLKTSTNYFYNLKTLSVFTKK